jgi:hypothetical protein
MDSLVLATSEYPLSVLFKFQSAIRDLTEAATNSCAVIWCSRAPNDAFSDTISGRPFVSAYKRWIRFYALKGGCPSGC